MACLKEELRTKDKKQIDIIYKKLHRYAARLGQETPDIKGTTKECKVEFINELTTNSNVLYAVLSDITISEYGCIEKKSRNPQYNMYNYSNYLQSIGFIHAEYNKEIDDLSVGFVDEVMKFLTKSGKKLIEILGYKAAINSVVSSLVNLYGIVDFIKAYEIFCIVTTLDKKIDYDTFVETAKSFAEFREEYGVCVFAGNFVSVDYVEIVETRGNRKISPKPSYYELICKQGDKPYYTDFSIESLLCYEKPGSFEINSQIDDFILYISGEFCLTDKEIFDVADDVCRACIEELSINDIFGMMKSKGLYSNSQKVQKMMVMHIMRIKSNIRLRINRGFTINEIRGLSYDLPKACGDL